MEKLPEVTLRAAEPSDAAFLRQLFDSHRGLEFAGLPLPPAQLSALLEQQFQAQTAQYMSAHPEAVYSVILLDGARIGRLTVAEDEVVHLVEISLLPAFQNQGIGGQLVSGLLEKGKTVRLSVQRFNPAQRLYLRLGFAVVGDDGMYLTMETKRT